MVASPPTRAKKNAICATNSPSMSQTADGPKLKNEAGTACHFIFLVLEVVLRGWGVWGRGDRGREESSFLLKRPDSQSVSQRVPPSLFLSLSCCRCSQRRCCIIHDKSRRAGERPRPEFGKKRKMGGRRDKGRRIKRANRRATNNVRMPRQSISRPEGLFLGFR